MHTLPPLSASRLQPRLKIVLSSEECSGINDDVGVGNGRCRNWMMTVDL